MIALNTHNPASDYSDTSNVARENAYQYRKATVLVLDLFTHTLRVFCAYHPDYIDGEPCRYIPMEVHHADGRVDRLY